MSVWRKIFFAGKENIEKQAHGEGTCVIAESVPPSALEGRGDTA